MKKSINQILDNIFSKKNYLLFWLLVISFLLRLIAVYYVKDTRIGHEQEWGILFDNLIKYKSYSFHTFNDQMIPSVFMPPMYPFLVYLLQATTSFEGINLLYFIVFVQIIFSSYSIYIFYQINQNFFSDKISLINSFIFAFVPLNVYVCGQISSVNLQILFSLLFLKFLFLVIKKQNSKNIIIFSLISGLLSLTRGEFIFIFASFAFYIFLKNKINLVNLVKIFVITFLIISPYVIRNYIHFDQVVIVKSLGFNLWKGNNQLSTVDGFETLESKEFNNLKFKLDNLKKNKYYEINRDKIFLYETLNNLSHDTYRYLKLFIKKIFSYFFIDLNSKYVNYYNFFHIFPISVLSILSLPGLILFYKKHKIENKCLVLYLFINLIIFSIFFILPRYKLTILPVQIILAAYFIKYILEKLNMKKHDIR